MRFPGEGGLGTKSVEVEVKGNGGNGLVGGIAIFEDLRRVQGLGIGVELGVDPVGHDALR